MLPSFIRSACCCACLLSLPWQDTEAKEKAHWLLGAVVTAETSRLDVTDLEPDFVPYIAWTFGGLHIGIDELSFEFGARDDIRWSVIGNPRYALGSTSARFDALERDFALEAGGSVAVGFFPWEFSATALSDITNTHGGQSVAFSLSQAIPMGPGEFEFELGLEYQSEKLAMHLYGIAAEEATSDLTAFNPKTVWKSSIAGTYFFEIGDRMAAQVQIEVNNLSNHVTQSERVAETMQVEAYVAVIRQF